jgi:DNA-binding SARP family transcriptional activator
MPIVRIQLFGAVRLFHGAHRNLDVPASCRPLLGYLCTHRNRRVARQEVAGTLWADFEDHRARRCLSTALWRLKSTLGLDIELLRSYGPDEIGLAPARSIWIDTAAFERRVAPWQGVTPERLDSTALHQIARARGGLWRRISSASGR